MQPKKSAELAPRDAAFVYLERSASPTNIVSVYAFDTASLTADGFSEADILAWMKARLHTSELYQRRLMRVPGDLGRPHWVHDDQFELRRHVFVAEDAITSWDELRRRIIAIAETRFDLAHPPWQLHAFTQVREVEGLTADAAVVVLKFHHSACDGIASVEIARRLFTADPPAPAGPDCEADAAHSAAVLLRDAVLGAPAQFSHMVTGFRDVLAANREAKDLFRRGEIARPVKNRPRTRFNHKISGSRTFGVARFSLSDVQSLRRAAGDPTVNDLMMAVVSLGLSELLQSADELPGESLAALVPFSTRRYRPGESVNQFVPMFVDLHTRVADPLLRLRAIGESSRVEKRRVTNDAVIRSHSTIKYVPSLVVRALSAVSALIPDSSDTTPYANTMITNVPRGPADLEFLSARSTSAFGVLALEDYDGLCHLIASLGDELTISFASTPESMPDPDLYTELLHAAYRTLSDAIRAAE